jgi:hypothetical protein
MESPKKMQQQTEVLGLPAIRQWLLHAMEGKPTVSQKPYRGRKILIATLLVVEEDFKAELKLLFEVFLRALFLVRKRARTIECPNKP